MSAGEQNQTEYFIVGYEIHYEGSTPCELVVGTLEDAQMVAEAYDPDARPGLDGERWEIDGGWEDRWGWQPVATYDDETRRWEASGRVDLYVESWKPVRL